MILYTDILFHLFYYYLFIFFVRAITNIVAEQQPFIITTTLFTNT